MESSQPSARRYVWLSLAFALVFVPVSFKHYIDGDEGYLLYAARLVAEGQALYKDFFYPQAPLVPSVFAIVFKVFGPGWYTGRFVAALIAVASGLLVFELGRHYSRSFWWGTTAGFLYLACGYTLGWIPIVKTYGLAVLCMLAAVYALERGGRVASILGGLLIVLALEARLYVGIIGLNAIVFLVRRHGWTRRGWLEVGKLGLGAVLGLGLLIPPFVRDFETAFFGIFQFASMRFPEQTTLFGPIDQKITILLAELSIIGNDGAGSAQLLGLVLLGMTAWFLPLPKNRLASTAWPTLLIANLLPFNAFTQYVCIVVPFVAIEATLVLSSLEWKSSARRALLPGLVLYGVLGGLDVVRFCHTGQGVIAVEGMAPAWRIGQIRAVARAIDVQGVTSAVSWWPGYFVSTKTHILPELANHFGFHVTERLSAERRRKLVLISESELRAGITERRYPLIVHGNWAAHAWGDVLNQTYKFDRAIGNTSFWVPP